jgi:SecD/SecF fusion protein
MQLKGLVRIFAILLTLITLYQLSFTFFVRNYESDVETKAKSWVSRNYANAKGSDADALVEDRKRYILDSTKNTKIGPFGFTTYKNAKDQELSLGLDLQGGMSVTMEVGLGDLLKSLADYTKDANFNKALEAAITKKANSEADLVSLFVDEYKGLNAGTPLATFFINKSASKIKSSSSDGELKNYLKEKADDAYNNTVRIITNRIDKFGVASPSINKNPQKGIVTIELAGVKEPERVRNILQSTANLQFFECYKAIDLSEPLKAANKALETYLLNAYDSTKKDTSLTKKIADTLFKVGIYAQGQPDQKTGQVNWPSHIVYVPKAQMKIVDEYLKLEVVASKFPPNTRFVYGKSLKDNDDKEIDLFPLYAIKTLDNGLSELEGDRITDARAEPDQFGKNAVSMRMDATGTSIWAKMTTRNVGKTNCYYFR